MRVHSFCDIEQAILMPGVRVGRHARIRRAIIDRDVLVPRGALIGFDAEEDRRRHTVTDGGVVVVTADDEPLIGPISEEALEAELEADRGGAWSDQQGHKAKVRYQVQITRVHGREILDSRGNPTVEADVWAGGRARPRGGAVRRVDRGARGARTARRRCHDAISARACARRSRNVNATIADALKGTAAGSARDRRRADRARRHADQEPARRQRVAGRLDGRGARRARPQHKQPLYAHLAQISGRAPPDGRYVLPVPMMNILNGGAHADSSVDFQEFMVMPLGASDLRRGAARRAPRSFTRCAAILKKAGHSTGVGDEGGFAPNLKSNREALDVVLEAIGKAGLRAGTDVYLALDVASSELWDNGTYVFKKSGEATRTPDQMVELYADWVRQYPIISIEDGVAEGDWDGWKALTRALGDRVQLVGDDVFVTNPEILRKGIAEGVGNALLVKLNQIGTVSETLDAIAMARDADYATVISHRSGETEDSTIADLAVGTSAGQIKTGSASRSDRVAKYNQLLRIEEELGERGALRGPGSDPAAGAASRLDTRDCHVTARIASPRREHVEQGEPVHRMDRRRSERQGPRGGARGRPADGRREIRVRRRVHVGAEARDPHAVDRARRDGHDVDSGLQVVAAERAPLRRAAGAEQGRDRREARRGAGEDLAAQLRHPAAAADPEDPRHPSHDRRYADAEPRRMPLTESLKDTVARFLPYWHETIAPDIKAGKRVLIVAHGNSLRALVKYLDNMSDDEIVELNIPTGIPLVYSAQRGSEAAAEVLPGRPGRRRRPKAAAVANQAKAARNRRPYTAKADPDGPPLPGNSEVGLVPSCCRRLLSALRRQPIRSDRRNRRSLVVKSNAFRAGSRRAGVVILVTAAPLFRLTKPDNRFERDPHVETRFARLGAAGLDLGVLGNGGSDRVGQLFREPVHDVIHSCSSSSATGPGSGAFPIGTCTDRAAGRDRAPKVFICMGLAFDKAARHCRGTSCRGVNKPAFVAAFCASRTDDSPAGAMERPVIS